MLRSASVEEHDPETASPSRIHLCGSRARALYPGPERKTMSRGQSTQAFNTASNENAADFGNAQSAFGGTEDAIGNYNNQLAKFVSGNPYSKGGEFDQTINNGLTNVSDAGANSLAGALQAQARRTGQNSAADAATTAAGAAQNTRNLSSDLAAAQQKRIAGDASYNQAALGASALPTGANQALYNTSLNGE